MKEIIDFVLHINQHLQDFVQAYGVLVYGLLFLIVFAETGLFAGFFLPGDSLLFLAGIYSRSLVENFVYIENDFNLTCGLQLNMKIKAILQIL